MALYRILSSDNETGTQLEFYGSAPVTATMLKCLILPHSYRPKVDGGENFKAPLPPVFVMGEVVDVHTMNEEPNGQEVTTSGGVRTDADTNPTPAAESGADTVSNDDAAANAEDAAVVRPTSEEPERTVFKQLQLDL